MKTFTLPVILDGIRSLKDRTFKLTFETNELTPGQFSDIGSALNQMGYLAFNPDPFTKKMIDVLETSKTDFDDHGKTKGQRLRAVLYRKWEQSKEDYEVFDDYYNHYMEKIITHYKSQLEPR